MHTTRADLHRIAVHVLGRRRAAVSGHFGLRASPLGVATPAFGPEPEVVRLAGPRLVREVGAAARSIPMDGATLTELAAFVEADLTSDFSAGDATPEPGPPHEPLHFDEGELDALYRWFDLGWRVLDVVTSDPVPGPGWSTIQLWPEHFDVGTGLDLGSGPGRQPRILAGGRLLRRSLRLRRSVGSRAAGRPRVLERVVRRDPAAVRRGWRRGGRGFPAEGLALLGIE